jgi:MYXO-CTERM domain-containing protein
MTMSRVSRLLLAGLLLGAASAPRAAHACGGTFCDSGPTAMPVDQTGENILFVMDGQNVEAHVQIQYQGAAERFAWLVPMPEIPEVEVGSQPLFTNLLQGTVPTYGFQSQFDQCGPSQGFGGGAGAGGSGTGGSAGSGGFDSGGPNVVFSETVGAFDVTVLQGGTATEVSEWLQTNGYQSIPTAPAILQDYVQKNFVFVAIKLTGGASVNEIHPLVFRYPGNQPCVPLKLTAVAAVEDMGVRTFFLGDDRVFPSNYMHVELNPARIDWQSFAQNYQQVVSRAVDSAVANGKAFVTEYAGPSNVVGPNGVYSAAWNEAAFVSILPRDVITTLNTQQLASCFDQFSCGFLHPLMVSLLREYLPAPAGVMEQDFYANLAAYETQIDLTKWDGAAFAADMRSRIIDPGKHARDVLAKYPFLTRMFTTISPAEMTIDPEFVARPDLSNENVTAFQNATRRTTCSGSSAMLLPDGREVALPGSWPTFSSLMPWAERIEEVPATGPVIVLVDNTDEIDEQLRIWNEANGWPPPEGSGGSNAGGSGASSSGGSGARAGGANGGTNGAEDDGTRSSGGCACGVAGGAPGAGVLAMLAASTIAFARRRRRVRSSR